MSNIDELKERVKQICKETDTKVAAIETLVRYYFQSLGWTEKKAYEYAIGLFENGTIQQIKLLNAEGDNNG